MAVGDPDGRGRPSTDYAGVDHDDDLALTLSRLARSLQDEDSVDDTLRGIVAAAVDTVPGARHAALTIVAGRRSVHTRAGTHDVVYEVDRAQYETVQGPCLDAAYEQHTVRLSDMWTETRWPRFTRRAVELGIGSMLSLQLYVERDNLGALNLYSPIRDAFSDESEHIGLLFAAHASVAMAGARKQDQLNRAMAVRDLIGQAKGILMERHKLTGDEAFVLLVRASQRTNTKLRDVAAYLVDSGELSGRSDR